MWMLSRSFDGSSRYIPIFPNIVFFIVLPLQVCCMFTVRLQQSACDRFIDEDLDSGRPGWLHRMDSARVPAASHFLPRGPGHGDLGSNFGREVTDRRSWKCSFLLLVVRPGAPSSVLAPSSDARSP